MTIKIECYKKSLISDVKSIGIFIGCFILAIIIVAICLIVSPFITGIANIFLKMLGDIVVSITSMFSAYLLYILSICLSIILVHIFLLVRTDIVKSDKHVSVDVSVVLTLIIGALYIFYLIVNKIPMCSDTEIYVICRSIATTAFPPIDIESIIAILIVWITLPFTVAYIRCKGD